MATMMHKSSTARAGASTARIAIKGMPVLPTTARSRTLPVVKPSARGAALKATQDSGDFDAFLMKMADKFEKSENKPAVVGYLSAAVFVFFFSEWLIHLPALDILLGFPIQLLGLLSLPVLGLRYLGEKKDFGADVGQITSDITSKLPGLKKE